MEKLFVLAPNRIDVPADVRHVVYIVRPQYVSPLAHHLRNERLTLTRFSCSEFQ